MTTMAAAVFDGRFQYVRNHLRPELQPGWAVIRVKLAGICRTDMEILKGYMGFKGIPGHEFVGIVEECTVASWIGQRVVGEINAACGNCDWCARGLSRHCPHRTTLGINRLDGCMAEFCKLPVANLLPVPENIPDEWACLTEPLSAACEILEQLPVSGKERILVLGDGRMGILCALVLATVAQDVTLVGHHPEKLAAAKWRHVQTALSRENIEPGADIVVEATGSETGIVSAMALCRPRGTIVLKSTLAVSADVNLAPVVVNEQTILGSRCGRFTEGLRILKTFPDMPFDKFISARYPLEKVQDAFARAKQSNAIKVLLDIHP